MNWMVIAVMVNSVSFVHEIEQEEEEEDIVTVFCVMDPNTLSRECKKLALE